MLTTDAQTTIVRRFRQHAVWYANQRERVKRNLASRRAFERANNERIDALADFLKERGNFVHLQVLGVPNAQHVSEGCARVQKGTKVPALRASEVLCGQAPPE